MAREVFTYIGLQLPDTSPAPKRAGEVFIYTSPAPEKYLYTPPEKYLYTSTAPEKQEKPEKYLYTPILSVPICPLPFCPRTIYIYIFFNSIEFSLNQPDLN